MRTRRDKFILTSKEVEGHMRSLFVTRLWFLVESSEGEKNLFCVPSLVTKTTDQKQKRHKDTEFSNLTEVYSWNGRLSNSSEGLF